MKADGSLIAQQLDHVPASTGVRVTPQFASPTGVGDGLAHRAHPPFRLHRAAGSAGLNLDQLAGEVRVSGVPSAAQPWPVPSWPLTASSSVATCREFRMLGKVQPHQKKA